MACVKCQNLKKEKKKKGTEGEGHKIEKFLILIVKDKWQ